MLCLTIRSTFCYHVFILQDSLWQQMAQLSYCWILFLSSIQHCQNMGGNYKNPTHRPKNILVKSNDVVNQPMLAVVETGLRRHRTRSVHAGTRHFSLVSKSLLNRSYLYVGMKFVGPSLKPWKTCSTKVVNAKELESTPRAYTVTKPERNSC